MGSSWAAGSQLRSLGMKQRQEILMAKQSGHADLREGSQYDEELASGQYESASSVSFNDSQTAEIVRSEKWNSFLGTFVT